MLLPAKRGALANAARCVGQRNTLRLDFRRGLFVVFLCRKVCKNGSKKLVLQSVNYKTTLLSGRCIVAGEMLLAVIQCITKSLSI